MEFTLSQIKEVFEKKEYTFKDTINIIGIRSNVDVSNSFDDWLYVIYKNAESEIKTLKFPITTDPGKYWLENPMHEKGTAILVPDQYVDAYEIGLHRGEYNALKQVKPVKIWFDNNGDNLLNKEGPIEEGLYGINIHRSNPRTESSVVEKWSAGCQVFKKVVDFNFFMDLCKRSGDKFFTYTLLDESDF